MPRPRAALAAFLALAACAALLLTAGAEAKKKQNKKNQQPTTGRIEISTQPGGYPITIDGQPAGETTDYVRAIELDPGQHTVEIIFPNGQRWSHLFQIVVGRKECIALTYRPRTVSVPVLPVSPCPYPVNVSAPATIADGDIVTFSADVGYAGQSGLNYTWTISPPNARIAQGAGTSTITVDTTGVGNQRVTAILVVDDGSGDRNCRQRAQFATNVTALPQIPRPTGRQFAEFPSVAFNEDKANFDNFAVALQEDPTATGYVIVYNGRRSRPARLNTLVNRSRDYVVNTRNIDRSRITVIQGGTREADTIELWLVPQGAPPPRPSPR